jgi:hypothetical protein
VRRRTSYHRGDESAPSIDFPNDVVFGIGDEEIAVVIKRHGFWFVQTCGDSGSAVAGPAGFAASNDSSDHAGAGINAHGH